MYEHIAKYVSVLVKDVSSQLGDGRQTVHAKLYNYSHYKDFPYILSQFTVILSLKQDKFMFAYLLVSE